ncbi:hypothetical protein LAZ40_02175 [Cereibacter sphaeroides]|uniref:hypothetical protein n=1 Tax=Cereibacter sphaeroides TaxID=1063 RepID=UPI001F3B0B2D|nr:hypothetical protein [Cereibacter sphaeroides]MCE6957864.1 hypothetical protein [Cereibacter sphaeroides]MCE6971833.1 hypothetical protein [Cereibacter sphaeroides]
MPLHRTQVEVLQLLASQRSPDSYLAGGTLSGREGRRYSSDLDIFHSTRDITLACFEADRQVLERNGYTVLPDTVPRPGFVRAIVTAPDGEALRMDWAHESSFRFFPVIPDPLTGWQLHWADAATNKVLAAGGRDKARDAFDILYWNRNPLSLGALIWAAVGKDAGFSPDLLLDEILRNARLSPMDLARLRIEGPYDPIEHAARFRAACRDARDLIRRLPPETVGKLFVNERGEPIEPDPDDPDTLVRTHEGSNRGCWPTFPIPDDAPSP